MNTISKINHSDDNHTRRPLARKPLKNKIPQLFQEDLALTTFNPFSQQLTPWNGSSKLQASINLLKKQVESKQLTKHSSLQQAQPSVENIVQPDSTQYAHLAFHFSNHNLPEPKNRYACPRLKVNSQHVIVTKNSKDEVKRFLFNKKNSGDNKNIKKIANLTIEWDEDIVYNPQKKYFEEQSLKRKILREFSQTRNQNRNQVSKKQLKSEDKLFKLEFKNNKIHKKQVSIFQFKKKDFSVQLERSNNKKQKGQQNAPHLQPLPQNKHNNQIKVSNLSFQPRASMERLEGQEGQSDIQASKPFQSQKWKFRTSLKAKRTISPEKNIPKKGNMPEEKQRRRLINEQAALKQNKETLNRMTLELRQSIRDEQFTPLQVFARTSPVFFKKTLD